MNINDFEIKGVINIILTIILVFSSHGWMKHFGIFEGFKDLHFFLWYLFVVIYLGYFLKILIKDKKNQNKIEKEIYDFYTKGGIKPLKNIIIISDQEPVIEFLIIFTFLLIPFPFNVKINKKHKMILAFSKLGFYHFLAGLLKMI